MVLVIHAVTIIGNFIPFVLLTDASNTSIDPNEQFGCVNGFGCSNIFAVISAIFFGFTFITHVFVLCCITLSGYYCTSEGAATIEQQLSNVTNDDDDDDSSEETDQIELANEPRREETLGSESLC